MNILNVSDRESVSELARLMKKSLANKGTVFCFGNGGLAETSNHFVAELNKTYIENRDNSRLDSIEATWLEKLEYGYKVISLSSNMSVVTAIANDIGYDYVFAQQVYCMSEADDVVIGMTTSGKSQNVLYGLSIAKKLGATTILLAPEVKEMDHDAVDLLVKLENETVASKQEQILKFLHKLCLQFEKEDK